MPGESNVGNLLEATLCQKPSRNYLGSVTKQLFEFYELKKYVIEPVVFRSVYSQGVGDVTLGLLSCFHMSVTFPYPTLISFPTTFFSLLRSEFFETTTLVGNHKFSIIE